MSGRPNILLLVIDSARYDAFSCHNPEVGDTTPSIDGLAAGGLLCDNAFAAGGWTPPSHASMFTGELPSETGSLRPGPVLEADTTLAASETQTVEEMEKLLPDFTLLEDSRGEQGEDVKRRLRELGYV